MLDPNQRPPMYLVLKREYFDAFAEGSKSIEYRRYGGQFTERVYFVGRRVVLATRYDRRALVMPARVTTFRIEPAIKHPDMIEFYGGRLAPGDQVALIGLEVLRSPRRLHPSLAYRLQVERLFDR